MTALLFLDDPYLTEATATVTAHSDEGAVVLDRSIFYATGGGQPGDSGWLTWGGGGDDRARLAIATAVKTAGGGVGLVASELAGMPPVGSVVTQHLDWDRRHRHMRMHTALHLLSVVIPLPVTGGQIGTDRSRLDFDMPEPPADMARIEAALNALIDRDLPVTQSWITEAELAANPGLVKTMSVRPPVGQGRVRLIRIGQGADQIDLQPCGGTHVARTAEVGTVALGKVEKKGRQNRRVSITLA